MPTAAFVLSTSQMCPYMVLSSTRHVETSNHLPDIFQTFQTFSETFHVHRHVQERFGQFWDIQQLAKFEVLSILCHYCPLILHLPTPP